MVVRGVVVVLVLAAIAFAGAVAFVPSVRNLFFGAVTDAQRQLSGHTPARTPEEAISRFLDAVKSREYQTAAEVYCGGEYAEQMRKAAPAARELGVMIDRLKHQLDQHGYDSKKIKFLLNQLEPFPPNLTVSNLQKSSGDRALATLAEGAGGEPLTGENVFGDVTQFETGMFRVLAQGLGHQVELRAEGAKPEEKVWRLYFPMTPGIRAGVDRLIVKHLTYCRALESVKHAVEHDKLPKADLEDKFRQELVKCKTD